MTKYWHTALDYLALLQNLLPLGLTWNRTPGSNLTKILAASAAELARLDVTAQRALNEINPLTTMELLPEWEAVCGLPDECSPAEDLSISARRQAVLQKLRRPVGQHPAFFEGMAADYGYESAQVKEFTPFAAETSGAEGALNDAPGGVDENGEPSLYHGWTFVWLINLGAIAIREFAAEDSGAEDFLREWGDDGMECRIRRAAPAHTLVLFAYNEQGEDIHATSSCTLYGCRPA